MTIYIHYYLLLCVYIYIHVYIKLIILLYKLGGARKGCAFPSSAILIL